MNGWGPKSSIRPSKPGKSNFLGGVSGDFDGISRGCPKSLRKKSSCSISVPYLVEGDATKHFSSGTNFCTGDFAPPKPEFGPEFWEANFGRPNFGPEFLGRIF